MLENCHKLAMAKHRYFVFVTFFTGKGLLYVHNLINAYVIFVYFIEHNLVLKKLKFNIICCTGK